MQGPHSAFGIGSLRAGLVAFVALHLSVVASGGSQCGWGDELCEPRAIHDEVRSARTLVRETSLLQTGRDSTRELHATSKDTCAGKKAKRCRRAPECSWDRRSNVCSPAEATPAPTPADASEEYIPGTPGGAWTDEEALAVKAKLFKLFSNSQQLARQYEQTFKQRHGQPYECVTGPHWNETCGVWPPECKKDICRTKTTPKVVNLAATVLRLGFHDCFKYKDGTGGCDGCLELGPMFRTMSQTNSIKKRIWPDNSIGGGNNGLQMAADLLEEVYTDKNYPSGTPSLAKSMKLSGKSRADLWAFAAMAAAEYGQLDNNKACVGATDRTRNFCDHLYTHVPGLESKCVLNQANPPKFFTGRADCTSKPADPVPGVAPHVARAWETDKAENPAGSYFNGTDITNYFKQDFGLSRQETVALMGAHSYGGFNFGNSGFKYTWQWQLSHTMSNNYYRVMLGKDTKFLQCTFGQPTRATGGPNGGLARSGWFLRPLHETPSGGSFLWFHYYERCPDCMKENGVWKSYEARGGAHFQSDECCKCNEQDPTDAGWDPECFINVTRDETAIHADMALAYRFGVSENGVIQDGASCPGLNLADWNAERLADPSLDDKGPLNGGIASWENTPSCKSNDEKDAGDTRTMREWVEHYAEDQNAWIEDFDRAFEKMLLNGYTEQDLTLGPEVIGLGKTHCARVGRTYVCEQTPDVGPTGVQPSLLAERSAMLNTDAQMSA